MISAFFLLIDENEITIVGTLNVKAQCSPAVGPSKDASSIISRPSPAESFIILQVLTRAKCNIKKKKRQQIKTSLSYKDNDGRQRDTQQIVRGISIRTKS